MTAPPGLFGAGARFHHVGLGVRSLRDAAPGCRPHHEERQGVRLAFVDLHGLRVELLEPAGEDSPIARSVRDGQKLLHLCFEVPDLEAAVAHCRARGLHRLGRPVASDVFDGRRVAWVYGRELGLFELIETSNGGPG